jgi:alpha-1,4-fucosyltransferase
LQRKKGEPLRVYMDLEPGRRSPGYEDIFVSYHAGDTLQATYAGASFHTYRNFFTSPTKRNVFLEFYSTLLCSALSV